MPYSFRLGIYQCQGEFFFFTTNLPVSDIFHREEYLLVPTSTLLNLYFHRAREIFFPHDFALSPKKSVRNFPFLPSRKTSEREEVRFWLPEYASPAAVASEHALPWHSALIIFLPLPHSSHRNPNRMLPCSLRSMWISAEVKTRGPTELLALLPSNGGIIPSFSPNIFADFLLVL